MTRKTIVLDLESDGLTPKVVWIVVTKELETGKINKFYGAKEFNSYLESVDEIIGHNIIKYDLPVLKRLWGCSFDQFAITDTLVLSRLYNPSLDGGHSLRSWGERFKFPKGDFTDFKGGLTDEMVKYCVQDVEVTEKLYNFLVDKVSSESVALETRVQEIICQQELNGWLLDVYKCYDLLAELKEKINEVTENVLQRFTPLPNFVKTVKPKYKANGSLSVVGLKFLGDSWVDVGGEFSRIDWPTFNLGSRQQIGRYLQYFGWKPSKFTETGQPIVDEKTLEGVNVPEAKLIAEYLLLTKRQAQVNSWVDSVADDGRVHGEVNAIGAVTGRMTHSKPNMAQVPASYSPYGKECRSVWVVPKGYKLVGCDASGLELRMLAHYMNDSEYTEVLLNGDIHTHNQGLAGLSTRDQAKTFIYAYLYGAGDAKIGTIVGGSKRRGGALKEKFQRNLPSLTELRDRVERASAKGYLKGLDGRHLHIRSAHAALNTLLQSAGAVVMKQALVTFVDFADKWELNYRLVGNIHDEVQMEVIESQAEQAGYLFVECIKAAGVHFGMNCPLDGEYKIGNNWSETH